MPKMNTVVVFGDSLSDIGSKWRKSTGRFAAATGQMVVNPTGRFSDCRNWTDYMYEAAGGDSLIVASPQQTYERSQVYMALNTKSWALGYANKTGTNFQYVNYAEGGACGDTPASVTLRAALGTFKDQVDVFEKEAGLTELGNTLFIVWFGANDLYTAGCKPEQMAAVANTVAMEQRSRLRQIVKSQGSACWFTFIDLAMPLSSVRYSLKLKTAKQAVKEAFLSGAPKTFRTEGYKPIGGWTNAAREHGLGTKQLERLDEQMKEIQQLETGVFLYNARLSEIANRNNDYVVNLCKMLNEKTLRALVRGNNRLKKGASLTYAEHKSAHEYDLLSENPDLSTHVATIDEAHPNDPVYKLIWMEIYKVITKAGITFGTLPGLSSPTPLELVLASMQ